MTAACVRGCAASIGLLVTGKRKENGDTENCKGDVRGGGGGELVTICQYFIRQQLDNVMPSLLQNHSLCTRPAAKCTSLILGMESPLKAAYEDIASPKNFVHRRRRVGLSVNERKAIQQR